MVFTSIEWRARRASTGSNDWRQEETTQLKWLGSPPSQDHQRRLGALAKNLRIRQLDGTPNHKWSDYSHSRMHALNSSFMTDKPDISRHLHQDLAQRIPKIIDKQNKTNPYQASAQCCPSPPCSFWLGRQSSPWLRVGKTTLGISPERHHLAMGNLVQRNPGDQIARIWRFHLGKLKLLITRFCGNYDHLVDETMWKQRLQKKDFHR